MLKSNSKLVQFLCCSLLSLLVLRTVSAAVPLHPGLVRRKRAERRQDEDWRRSLFKRVVQAHPGGPLKTLEDGDGDFDGNCSNIREYPERYNSSCDVVKEQCGDTYELFNYLEFVTCDIGLASLQSIATLG